MYFGARNSILFARKHANSLQWTKFCALLGLDFAKETAKFVLRRPTCALSLKLAGAVDGFLGRPPRLKKLGLA